MTDVYFRDDRGRQVILTNLELLEVASESFVYSALTPFGTLYFETRPDPTIKDLVTSLRMAYEAERAEQGL